MQACPQTSQQFVFEHGMGVWNHLQELLLYLRSDHPLDETRWRKPEWLDIYGERLISGIWDDETLKSYTVFHDCGKPRCRTVDDLGRQHFPNHAEVSYKTWLSVSDDLKVANLIRRDMEIHTLKGDSIVAFCENPRDAISLLLVGLCEVHSNAAMFGGVGSDSFKIKWKHLNKRGKAICKHLFDCPV